MDITARQVRGPDGLTPAGWANPNCFRTSRNGSKSNGRRLASNFDELTQLAEKELKRSGEFVLPGMVKLVVQKRKARMGRNPATGEAIKIPAKTVVKARIAKQLKDAVLPKSRARGSPTPRLALTSQVRRRSGRFRCAPFVGPSLRPWPTPAADPRADRSRRAAAQAAVGRSRIRL